MHPFRPCGILPVRGAPGPIRAMPEQTLAAGSGSAWGKSTNIRPQLSTSGLGDRSLGPWQSVASDMRALTLYFRELLVIRHDTGFGPANLG